MEQAIDTIAQVVRDFRRSQNVATLEISELAQLPKIGIAEMVAFLALVQAGSFTEAARRTGMSQPGMSRRIQRLERAFGSAVVSRHGSGQTSLTAFGVLVHHFCKQSVELFSELLPSE